MTPIETDVTVLWQVTGPPSIDDASVQALVSHILAEERATGRWNVAVVLSTNHHIQALHRDYMGLDSPTDIMTFAYEPDTVPVADDDYAMAQGGDVVISVEQAAVNAEEEGWETADEILFLICHGVLHLIGWDDGEPGQRDAMLNRQREILGSFRQFG